MRMMKIKTVALSEVLFIRQQTKRNKRGERKEHTNTKLRVYIHVKM